MEGIAAGKYRAGEMRLACFGTNTAALLLYAKLGYEPYEIEPRTARDGEMHALTKRRRKLR